MSYLEFVAGCNAGLFGVLVGHPFDTIKVKLQTSRSYNQSAIGLLRSENMRSIYRGISSPLVCLTFINAIVFGSYGNCVRLFDENKRNHIQTQFFAGCIAGAAQSTICSPMELIRNRMQVQGSEKTGALRKQFLTIIREQGWRGLFRGYGLTLARDGPAFGLYFSSYEWMLSELARDSMKDQPSNGEILFAGGLAGMISWLLLYPVDVLKTKVQLGEGDNWRACIQKMYENGGWNNVQKSLSRGLFTTIVRAFPVNAASFFAYDIAIRRL